MRTNRGRKTVKRAVLRILAVIAATALLVAAVGCAANASSGPLALTASADGSSQTLSTGQQMQITLESNPSTGYRWAVDGTVPPQLTQDGDAKYLAPKAGAVGAAGTEVWTFTGATAGQGTLKLKYWRSFEPTATPAKTFTVTVDVK
jgi:inhibitor of cysteine peptidase